jgi:hypothetical protein
MIGNLLCIFGSHDMEILNPSAGFLASPKRCRRCGKYEEGITWTRGDSPPMPKVRPPKRERY